MTRNLSVSLSLLLVIPTVACATHGSSSSPSGDDSTDPSALEQTNGGYDTSDEAPEFGAQDMIAAAQIEDSNTADDTLASDPSATSMTSASAGKGMNVIVLWGKMPADKDATVSRDWTGQLQTSRGGLLVRHTVGFEDSTDKLLPRPSLTEVAFQSVTKPYVDGLALTVLDPDGGPSTTPAPTLTYTSATDATISYQIDLSQLINGPIVIDAGDGFKMVAVGHRRQLNTCDSGFMHGRWHAISANFGDFLGVVTDDSGAPDGTVEGIWGQRSATAATGAGDQVMFGKFIDNAGKFRGLLIGSYSNGTYTARWIDRNGDHGGASGLYFAGAAVNTGRFLGRWAEAGCSDDPPPPTTTPAPTPAPAP